SRRWLWVAGGSVGAHISAKAASRRMTRATAARRPAVDLSARPNTPAKGSQFKKRYVTALGTCTNSTFPPTSLHLLTWVPQSLGPAPDPRNRHALTGACNPVHAADGGGRVTRSRLVRFGRRAPSTSADDAAGDQPTGGYSAVLSLRPRAVSASGLQGWRCPVWKCPCARRGRCRRAHRSAECRRRTAPAHLVEEQVLRRDTEIEP